MIKDWRKQWYWALCVILLLPLLFINVPDFHDWGGDFAMYIIQAINLVEGHPQSATGYIHNPDFVNNGPANYPIGYSILLAPVYAIFGNDMGAFQVLQSFLAIGFGLALFAFAKQHLSWWASLLVMIIMVYNPWFLNFKREIMSEFSFMIFTFVFLISVDRKWMLIALILGVMAVITRAAGWVMVPTILVVMTIAFLKDRQWNLDLTKTTFLLVGLFVSVLVLDNFVFQIETSGSSYSDHLIEYNLLENAWGNLIYFKDNWTYHLVEFLQKWGWKSSLPFTGFVILTLVGAFKIHASYPHQVWYYFGYIGLLLVYPFSQSGFRFIFPIVCFALVLSAVGLKALVPNFKGRAILFTALVLAYMSTHSENWKHIIKYQDMVVQGPQHADSQELFGFIENEIEANQPILFSKPRVLALYTGHSSVVNHPNCDESQLRDLITEHEVELLLSNKFLGNSALDTFIVRNPQELDLEFSNNSFKMYRLKQ